MTSAPVAPDSGDRTRWTREVLPPRWVGVRRSKALGLLARPARVLELLGEQRPRGCRPALTATLYVHVSRETFAGDDEAGGVARVEDVGPVTVGQVREFLGETAARVVVPGSTAEHARWANVTHTRRDKLTEDRGPVSP